MSSIEHDSIPVTAAPGVTKEVEDAISLYRLAVCNDLQNITHERVAARAALLAAVGKEIAATRAERDALAALVDEVIRDSTPPRPNSSVVFHFKAWLSRAKALRAPQTGGANDGQT